VCRNLIVIEKWFPSGYVKKWQPLLNSYKNLQQSSSYHLSLFQKNEVVYLRNLHKELMKFLLLAANFTQPAISWCHIPDKCTQKQQGTMTTSIANWRGRTTFSGHAVSVHEAEEKTFIFARKESRWRSMMMLYSTKGITFKKKSLSNEMQFRFNNITV